LTGLKDKPPEIQQVLDEVIQHFGPSLATALVRGIGGDAARSELNVFSEPLKKLITRHPRARLWLESALLGPQFPSGRVNDQQRRVFLQQVVNARGSRGTNDIVLEIWIKCRGTISM